MLHIAGVDLSLAATGICRIRIPDDGAPQIVVTTVESSSTGTGYPATLTRLRNIAGRVVRTALEGVEPDDGVIIAIEAPIFGTVTNSAGKPVASAGQAHTRAGLWWLVYHLLEKRGPIVAVPPASMKSYVTGKGNAPKDLVLATVVRNFPNLPILDNNQADAVGLASMVARQLGSPVEPSPQRVHPGALAGVTWPESSRGNE